MNLTCSFECYFGTFPHWTFRKGLSIVEDTPWCPTVKTLVSRTCMLRLICNFAEVTSAPITCYDVLSVTWKSKRRSQRSFLEDILGTSLRFICCSWHFSKWLLLQAVKVFSYQQLLLNGKFKSVTLRRRWQNPSSLPCRWDGDVHWKSPSRTVTWLDCTHEVHCAPVCSKQQDAKDATSKKQSTYEDDTTTKKHIFPQEVRIFDRGIYTGILEYSRNMYCRERPDENLNTSWDQNFSHMSYMTSTWGLGLILDFNNGLDSKLLSVGVVIWVMVVMKRLKIGQKKERLFGVGSVLRALCIWSNLLPGLPEALGLSIIVTLFVIGSWTFLSTLVSFRGGPYAYVARWWDREACDFYMYFGCAWTWNCNFILGVFFF